MAVLSELRDADLTVLAEVIAEAEERARTKAIDSMRLDCGNCRDKATEAHRARLLALGRIRRALRS
jgi:hypothetical protein